MGLYSVAIVLTVRRTVSFWRRAVLHGVTSRYSYSNTCRHFYAHVCLYCTFLRTDNTELNTDFSRCIHLLTTDDVKSTKSDVGIHIEALGSDFLLQLVDQYLALLREHFHEVFQDLEVEGRCDHLPVGVPFLSWWKPIKG